MWLLGELELAHEHIDAGGKFGGLDSADFLAMNPHGRVCYRTAVRPSGNPTPSCAISPRAIVPENSGPAIRAALKRCARHFESWIGCWKAGNIYWETLADIAIGTSLYRR